MMDHRTIRYIAPLLLLLLSQGLAAAQTVYVKDEIRLGIREVPASGGASLAMVTTGDALTVLEEQEAYLKVRTTEGVEGWVTRSFTSSEPPARLRLAQLQQKYDALQAEREALAEKCTAVSDEHDALQGRLTALQQESDSLRQQLSRYTAVQESAWQRYRLPLQLLVLLLVFGAGVALGIRWYKQQVTRRLGGLEI